LIVSSGDTAADAISGLRSGHGGEVVRAGPVRIAVVARDDAEQQILLDMLDRAGDPELVRDDRVFFSAGSGRGEIVFMFPGQGSQRSGMFAGLRAALPAFDARLTGLAARRPESVAVLEMIGTQRSIERDGLLARTQYAQPALALVCSTLVAELARFGVVPGLMIGHSFGELVALSAAGCCTADDLVSLSVDRGRAMARAGERNPGRMVAVAAESTDAMSLLRESGVQVELAAVNSPSQVVLAGAVDAIAAARAVFERHGVRCSPTRTSAAFHSSLMAPARDEFTAALSHVEFAPFAGGVVGANVTGDWHCGDPEKARELLAEQLTRPVRWTDNVRTAYGAGGRIFVEVGPGNTLSALCERNLDDEILSLSMDHGRQPADVAWLTSLAHLAVRGVLIRNPEGLSSERVELRSEGDSPAVTGTNGAEPAELIASNLPAVYLREASRQVEAYFQWQNSLVGANPDSSNIHLALELNSGVVTSFLEWGARAVTGWPGTDGTPSPPVVSTEVVHENGIPALVAELTGYPVETISGDMRLEEDLGMTSISLVELLSRVGEPGRSIDNAVLTRVRTVDDLVAICHGADQAVTDAGSATAEHDDALAEIRRALGSLTGLEADEIAEDLRLEDDLGIVSIALIELLVQYRIVSMDKLDQSVLLNLSTVGDLAELLRTTRARATPTSGPVPVSTSSRGEPIRRYGFHRLPMTFEAGAARPVLVVCADAEFARELRRDMAAAGYAVTVWLVERDAFVIDDERHAIDSVDLRNAADAAFGSGELAVLFATGRTGRTSADVALTGLALSALARSLSPGRENPGGLRIGVLVPGSGAPEATTAIGYARALRQEWPDVIIRCLRLEGARDRRLDVPGTAAVLLNGSSDTHLVMDSAGRLWREAHTPMPIRDGHGVGMRKRDGVVLATGGGDGITAEILVAIAQRWQCPIAVLGRTRFPGDEQTARVKAIRRTKKRVEEAGSEFAYHRADATDADAVRTAVAQVVERFGPVRGLILGAGAMREDRIEAKTRAVESAILDAKIAQANIFRDLFEKEDLDFAVLFSSIASYTGNIAQADYVAANLAFEELGTHWNRSSSYPVRSILWSIWDETGLAPPWLRTRMTIGGLQGIKNAVGAQLMVDELERADSTVDRVLLAPESVLTYLMRSEVGVGPRG
jgi:malonyl CoA-acyl carrier protein transacylase